MTGSARASQMPIFRVGDLVVPRYFDEPADWDAIGIIVAMGIWYGTTLYFEMALLFAMVGFLTTVSFCKFFLRGNVIE